MRERATEALRRFATCTLAGAVAGVVVGGVGGRLAMVVLARLNREATGVVSDDGFRIGQFTSETLGLLAVGLLIGVVGGAIYCAVRHLRVGPRWFDIAALAIGPAVVVGAFIVHTDGVDFTVLDPVLLAIALFVAIPALYGALVTLLAERWLRPGAWPSRAPAWLALAPLALWIPILPVALVFVVGWIVISAARSVESGRRVLDHPIVPFGARVALAAVFGVGVVDLARDVAALT